MYDSKIKRRIIYVWRAGWWWWGFLVVEEEEEGWQRYSEA